MTNLTNYIRIMNTFAAIKCRVIDFIENEGTALIEVKGAKGVDEIRHVCLRDLDFSLTGDVFLRSWK